MNSERLGRIVEIVEALDADNERPDDPDERLAWLQKHRSWQHNIQSLVLDEIEDTWQEQQIARAEIEGDA